MAEWNREVTKVFERWSEATELRVLKVNLAKKKKKVKVTRKKTIYRIQPRKWSCGVCRRVVGANSVMWLECNKRYHQRCSGLRRLVNGAKNFQCPTCRGGGNKRKEERGLITAGGGLEEVQYMSYLGNVLDCEAGVERAVTARVAVAWRKWKEMVSLLIEKYPTED